MQEYTVIYEIQVDGETPLEAALEVEKIMKDPIYRPAFIVEDKSGEKTVIDLETEEEKC